MKLTIVILCFSIIYSGDCKGFDFGEKFEKFDFNLLVLDDLTKVFNEKDNLFLDRKYLKYSLYRSLILNRFIHNYKSNIFTSELVCNKSNDNMGRLLKWKISMQFSVADLKSHDIVCTDEIEESKSIMEDYFLNIKFSDAYFEYFKYLKNKKDNDLLFLNILLKNSIQGVPNIKISEYLIENKKKIVEKYKGHYKNVDDHPVWNASVIAAIQGSKIGLESMKGYLIENKEHLDFISKIISLNNQRLMK